MSTITKCLDKIAGLTAPETILSMLPGLNAVAYPALRASRSESKVKTYLLNSALTAGGSVTGAFLGDAVGARLLKTHAGVAPNILTAAVAAGLGYAGARAGDAITSATNL